MLQSEGRDLEKKVLYEPHKQDPASPPPPGQNSGSLQKPKLNVNLKQSGLETLHLNRAKVEAYTEKAGDPKPN